MNILIYALVGILLSSYQANAYIDPGSGSFIIQILIASAIGFVALLKIYWDKFISLFSKGSDNKSDEDEY
ncbi:MAG: hypothetical protein V3U54_02015 [Thermodesulfobacteriota bacterium]